MNLLPPSQDVTNINLVPPIPAYETTQYNLPSSFLSYLFNHLNLCPSFTMSLACTDNRRLLECLSQGPIPDSNNLWGTYALLSMIHTYWLNTFKVFTNIITVISETEYLKVYALITHESHQINTFFNVIRYM